MTNLTYGDVTIDPTAIPETSRFALMQFGLSHFLGNVQASKLVTRIVAANKPDGDEGKNFKMDRDAIKAWRAQNGEAIRVWTEEHLKEALQEINEGTIGTRASGPRLDPVEREFQALLVREVTAVLKGVGLKMPKNDDEVLTFASGVTRTRGQMLSNMTASKGEALRKEAEAKVADAARKAKRAQDAAAKQAEAGPVDPGALGI